MQHYTYAVSLTFAIELHRAEDVTDPTILRALAYEAKQRLIRGDGELYIRAELAATEKRDCQTEHAEPTPTTEPLGERHAIEHEVAALLAKMGEEV